MSEGKKDLLTIRSGGIPQPFNYAVGLHGSKFFDELKQRRIVGVKCPQCGRVYVPPRKVCGPCFKEMNEWVEVGPKGKLETFTILRFAFVDPETGEYKPVPYGYGFIKFDGANTVFQHFVEIRDEAKVKVGARVEPVWSTEPKATIRDIEYFKVIDS